MRTDQHLTEPLEPPGATEIDQPISRMHPVLIGFEELRDLGIIYSKEHLRRLEATGQFPERVRLTPNRVAWPLDELVAWINDRMATRGQVPRGEKQDDKG